jgi:hypothetical protein
MEIKPKNAYRYLGVSHHTTNIVNLLHLHVSATLVAIVRDVPYEGYITETSGSNAQI